MKKSTGIAIAVLVAGAASAVGIMSSRANQAKAEAANRAMAELEAKLDSDAVANWAMNLQTDYAVPAFSDYEKQPLECPEVEAMRAMRPADEFDRKEREKREEAAIGVCFNRITDKGKKFPELARLIIPFKSIGEYDFTKGTIDLKFPSFKVRCTQLNVNQMLAGMTPRCEAVGDAIKIEIEPTAWGVSNRVGVLTWDELMLIHAESGLERGWSSLVLKVAETKAKDLKRRLAASEPRLLLAFKPQSYIASQVPTDDLMVEITKRTVFATAVAYQVRDNVGVVIGWTRFGVDEGRAPQPPRYAYEGSPPAASP
jgi:hypothetical protein